MTGLCTDLYELRMAASYLRRGMAGRATFSLFARRLPPERGFLVATGLDDCLTFLEGLEFDADELAWLRDVGGFTTEDVARMARLRFTGDVHAVPEGRVVLAGEPLLEITAPIAEAQLVETAMVNLVTFPTCVATKAARCRLAAPHAVLIDFAARRTHGLEAAMVVARTSAIAGFDATSYTAAAQRFGFPAAGTMAHSYIQAFDHELAAFRAFAEDFPQDTTLLVDTYDTLAGVGHAVELARELGRDRLRAVRLDSGDLGGLAVAARRMLDDAGLPEVRIIASGGLDEYELADLTAAAAPIDAYGVGTRMGVAADAPSLDSAYKLVEHDGIPVMKLSPGKRTSPGPKQVWRDRAGGPDVLALREEAVPAGYDALLVPVMVGGRRLDGDSSVEHARRRCRDDLERLPASARRMRGPEPPTVATSPALSRLTDSLVRALATT